MKQIYSIALAIILCFAFSSCEKETLNPVNPSPEISSKTATVSCRSEAVSRVIKALTGGNCAAVYQPVCGCDGKTYSNSCAAITSGVVAFRPGKCSELPGSDMIDVSINCRSAAFAAAFNAVTGGNCLQVYRPVCGCDGKTYSNECRALSNGVLVYTPGACGGITTN